MKPVFGWKAWKLLSCEDLIILRTGIGPPSLPLFLLEWEMTVPSPQSKTSTSVLAGTHTLPP